MAGNLAREIGDRGSFIRALGMAGTSGDGLNSGRVGDCAAPAATNRASTGRRRDMAIPRREFTRSGIGMTGVEAAGASEVAGYLLLRRVQPTFTAAAFPQNAAPMT